MSKFISIRGARVHNLKNISVQIPKNSFTVITGLSGSGKSSLAFDTIFAEGQRRYMESALYSRHHYRDLRFSPSSFLARGHASLPGLQNYRHQAIAGKNN